MSSLRSRHTTDPASFLERTRDFLRARPVECSLILSGAVAQAPAPGPGPGPAANGPSDAVWVWVEDGERVVAAAQHIPPRSAFLTPGPAPAIAAIAETLLELAPDLNGVEGPADEVEAFVRCWSAGRPVKPRPGMSKGVFVAGRVVHPQGVPGAMRRAGREDLPLLRPWGEAFVREASLSAGPVPDVVTPKVEAGLVVVWVVDDEVVSMAAVTPPGGGVCRVQLVYTPPEHRRQGFAGACVAALTARERAVPGRSCMLYTDLANPSTNKIYPAIGYRRVGDITEVRFVDSAPR